MFRYIVLLLLAVCSSAKAQDRGLLTLALLNDKFPVKEACEILSESPRPSFGFVYRAFGTNPKNLHTLIDCLANHPVRPASSIGVYVYLECGPCRPPRRPKGLFNIFLANHSISQVNKKLESGDDATLNAVSEEYGRVADALPTNPIVKYHIAPGLEDNYTPKAFIALKSIIEKVFIAQFIALKGKIFRNPQDWLIPSEEPIEIHTYEGALVSYLKPGDVITGDGVTLCFPNQKRCDGYNLKQVKYLISEAEKKGVTVLIYRADMQGLPLEQGNRPLFIPPSKRNYTISGKKYLIQLMKG